MRSRTEMVTTTFDGSDFDEDSDFEDSEEDWKPEKGDPKSLKRKSRDILSGTGGRRGGAGRNGNGKKRGRKPAAKGRSSGSGGGRGKRKSGQSSEDDDDIEDEDEEEEEEDEDDDLSDSEDSEYSKPTPRKRGRSMATGKKAHTKRANGRKSATKTSPSTSKGAAAHGSRTGLDSSGSEPTIKPIQRKVVNLACSFPDKSGLLKLFAYRGDLEEGIRDNLKLCLWRRDGSSLLQKYFRDKSVDASTPQFTSSMVYSCWQDKRSDLYMEVKVRCIEQSKQLRVQIIDVDATEKKAKEEYEKFVAQYGKAGPPREAHEGRRSNGSSGAAASGSRKQSKRERNVDNDEALADEETAEEEEEDEEDEEEGDAAGEEGEEEEEEQEEENANEMAEESGDPPQEE